MGRFTKRSAAIVAAAVVAVGGAGAAYAAWNVNSAANVTVTAGSAAQVTVSAENVTGLHPGGVKPVKVTIANPNPFNVKITSITGPVITGGGECASDETGIVVAKNLPAPIVLGKNMGSKTIDIPNVISMTNESATECQGKSFNFEFTLVGASTADAATPGLA